MGINFSPQAHSSQWRPDSSNDHLLKNVIPDFPPSGEVRPLEVPLRVSKHSLARSFIWLQLLTDYTSQAQLALLGTQSSRRGSDLSPKTHQGSPRGQQGVVDPALVVREGF